MRTASLLLLLAATAAAAASDDVSSIPWSVGRATYYSAPGDTWTIHDGSCTHQYIWPDIGTGWDAGALSDQNPGEATERRQLGDCPPSDHSYPFLHFGMLVCRLHW